MFLGIVFIKNIIFQEKNQMKIPYYSISSSIMLGRVFIKIWNKMENVTWI